jgi:hypothetical protein
MAAGMKPKAWGGAPKRSNFMSKATVAPAFPRDSTKLGPWNKLLESQGAAPGMSSSYLSSNSMAGSEYAGKPTVVQPKLDQAKYDTATADYDQAMKDIREDAADYVSEWSNKMAPKPGSTGQARAAPDSMGQLMASTMAPADEGGLYGVPGDPISSIVNLKKKRRA